MGLPVVATDIRGCRQVVDHGVTGLLVPAHDPAALAAAIRRLAEDQALRATMSVAARDVAPANGSINSSASTRRCPCMTACCGAVASEPRSPRLDERRRDQGGNARRRGRASPRFTPRRSRSAFSSSLGEPFLEQLYRRVAGNDGSFVFVHVDRRRGSTVSSPWPRTPAGSTREFMMHDGLRAGWRAPPCCAIHGGCWRHFATAPRAHADAGR